MPTNASTPPGATLPQPVQAARASFGRRQRTSFGPVQEIGASGAWLYSRVFRVLASVGLLIGFQGMTVAPAAVATLPSALIARPFAPAPRDIEADIKVELPPLINAPEIFGAIPETAFTPKEKPLAKLPPVPADAEYSVENPDEIIPFSGRNAPRWLVHSILKAARVTGVDPVYMMTLADIESSLSPEAKAPTSTAEGLFQFIDRTWLETVFNHASDYGFSAAAEAIRMVDGEPVVIKAKDREWIMNLRCDPYFSALMAGELIKDIERALQAQGERELSEAELYIAHFLGAGSAVRFLEVLDKDPNMKASKLFPQAAKANTGLFMEGRGRKRRSVTVAEFYNNIDSKIVKRMDRYEDIGPYIAEVTRMSGRTQQATVIAR
ncbi:transglycosylase SLT domain-containing protein [Microvirga terricola]|uniref:Transglycosylase SLT domain-containing protein n=1 Tax=Microvirga terricola TaxID=2719797 RepID=A0ABX0VAJ1_9HYPH|nr:transglycosylase SLT domain-containing protein [Microvirga terricola]NIX76844.1 transglycosylase SLT domain-containing protein [Microvirga terricola]